MSGESYTQTWTWKWIVRTKRGAGLRSALAWCMRRIGDRIDGLKSIGVHVQSDPPVPHAEILTSLAKGFEHAERLHREAIKVQCTERALRKLHPDLYADEGTTGCAHDHHANR